VGHGIINRFSVPVNPTKNQRGAGSERVTVGHDHGVTKKRRFKTNSSQEKSEGAGKEKKKKKKKWTQGCRTGVNIRCPGETSSTCAEVPRSELRG